MMADAMELRDVELLEKFEEIGPCPAVVKRDETPLPFRNKQLRGKDFLLLWQIVTR